jgi:hypothetical protein
MYNNHHPKGLERITRIAAQSIKNITNLWLKRVATFILNLISRKANKILIPSPKATRQRIKNLILGKGDIKVYRTERGFKADEKEVIYTIWKHQYRVGKLFEAASRSPDGKLDLGGSHVISPDSREQGLESGRFADKLRAMVILQYGVDIATLEDLEEDEATAQDRKNKALLSIDEV